MPPERCRSGSRRACARSVPSAARSRSARAAFWSVARVRGPPPPSRRTSSSAWPACRPRRASAVICASDSARRAASAVASASALSAGRGELELEPLDLRGGRKQALAGPRRRRAALHPRPRRPPPLHAAVAETPVSSRASCAAMRAARDSASRAIRPSYSVARDTCRLCCPVLGLGQPLLDDGLALDGAVGVALRLLDLRLRPCEPLLALGEPAARSR